MQLLVLKLYMNAVLNTECLWGGGGRQVGLPYNYQSEEIRAGPFSIRLQNKENKKVFSTSHEEAFFLEKQ